jgi:transposase
MDGQKESLAVADVAQAPGAEVVALGPLGTRPCDLAKLIRPRRSQRQPLVLVYDAGPCGYGLSRALLKKGSVCGVVAPSLLPKQAGDRVTSDRRDARPLARLLRSGDLTSVDVPTVADEASRDLSRAREDSRRDLKTAKWRLNAFWLRHDIRDTGQATWSPAHRRWLSEGGCPTPAPQLVFQAYVQTVTAQTARLHRLEQALQEPVKTWRLSPVVEALQALRGVQCPVAVTTVAELGDLTRVDHPRQLRHDLGLTPSESSRGARRQQGSMTKTGKAQARRALVEGAWASRYPAHVSRHRQRRLEKLPTAIQAISWKAPVRLCTRYRQRLATGTHAHQVVVAMARE